MYYKMHYIIFFFKKVLIILWKNTKHDHANFLLVI